MQSDLIAAAHEYLSAGLEVIALVGKKPNTKFHPHGLTDCMSGVPENEQDDALIRRVFGDPKTTGVGILIPDWRMVADVDSEEAAQTLLDLAGELPSTAVAKTRNGLHFWFVTTKTRGSFWVDKLLLRGKGSYVVAPPSEHPDGGTYAWIGDERPWLRVDYLPDAIEAQLIEQEAKAAEKPAPEDAWFTEATFRPGGFTLTRALDQGALGGLKHAIIKAEDGNQNNVIAWAAMTARDEGIPLDTAMGELLAAAIEGGHPERRARDTIKAAYRRSGRG
jgi:hypothetical protein